MSLIKEAKVGDKTICFEFQKFAKQANGSVMVSCGDTQVLVTVCASEAPKEGQDFFPLSVDYIEKFYAAGRIPGGFVKRETKPSEAEVLTARVIDRPLRPSFPEEFLCETQVVCTVMSVDPLHHPAPLAMVGASTALMISDIPFNGPVASIRVGKKDGQLVLDPVLGEEGDLDLTLAANPDAVLMVEAAANFLSEDEMIEAITFAHDAMRPLFEMQKEVQKEIGKPKRTLTGNTLADTVYPEVQHLEGHAREALQIREKQARVKGLKALKDKIVTELNPDGDSARGKALAAAYEKLIYVSMRNMILDDRKRIDGRSFTDIRQITCETKVLKRTHGSALFTRGETQALATVTLGSADDEQRMDSILQANFKKAFMLHYNFPPFSVGEAKPMRAPGRREVGHGALAYKALEAVLPETNKFNYTIRLVSEVLESNGSSSMATVCAGTMALLDAGVPIKQPVAGIAMGLVMEGDKYAVLSDILGDEDHLGDMDFKVTGGQEGITALQMDIKISGLNKKILAEALAQAKEGRQFILKKLVATINEPAELSQWAPQIFEIKIKEDKIRDLIGPGGKTIKKLVADLQVKIDISDNGIVNIMAPDGASAERAKQAIRAITADPEVGAIYLGTIKKVVDFGAFVELRPGLEGLLHISQLENRKVDRVTDIVNEGEQVLVKVIDVDRQGKIKLSRKDALGKRPTV
ncbi:MAG TPA: polyribonucleotide nucleotidyltransferase [Oligoflexus sp.]|nr:polyribonucleotide nucleotidyltransferase [Oligoflexus sp.]HET9236334.1 polyribonucleotide nucleotidyltransferase [Oligoflexus sp.]